MALNKTSILFNGGRKIKLSTSTTPGIGNDGIKITKNADDSWNISINAVISKDEANSVMFKFEELNSRLPGGSTPEQFEEAFPNMLYFSAMDVNGKPVFVKLAANSEILPVFDRDLGGSITLKLNIVNLGKTQNPKTQNAAGLGH
jgi:hypothetical protein